MSQRKALLLFAALSLLVATASACNDVLGGCNDLIGPTDYNLNYDRVEIYRQQDAMVILYMRGAEIPAKIVVNFPIEVGKEKVFTSEGSVTRTTSNNVQFPDVQRAVVTFDELGEVGGDASGKFVVGFVSGSSLSGEFCGTVQELSAGF